LRTHAVMTGQIYFPSLGRGRIREKNPLSRKSPILLILPNIVVQ